MVIIETTTRSGQVFESPFIYTESAGKVLIHNLSKWHKKPHYRLIHVPLKDCPVDRLYNQTWGLADILRKLPIAEGKCK